MTGPSESRIKSQILIAVGSRPDIRLWNNPVGSGWVGVLRDNRINPDGSATLVRPRRVTFGLAPASPDLIGLVSIEITPDMVGRRVAVFVGAEVKKPGEQARPDQAAFHEIITAFGGRSGVVRSVEDMLKLAYNTRPNPWDVEE